MGGPFLNIAPINGMIDDFDFVNHIVVRFETSRNLGDSGEGGCRKRSGKSCRGIGQNGPPS